MGVNLLCPNAYMINKKPPSKVVWNLNTFNCTDLRKHHVVWAFNQFKQYVKLDERHDFEDVNLSIVCGIQEHGNANYYITENATFSQIEIFHHTEHSLLCGIAQFLGLSSSIASESVFNNVTQTHLSVDDIDGIKALYQSFSSQSNIDYHFHVN